MLHAISFPYEFKLAGETWELNQAAIRKVLANGIEQKMSLDGKIIGVAVSEPLNELAIAIEYEAGHEVYFMTKKQGWLGPFTELESIDFDLAKKAAVIKAKKDGAMGTYVLA